MVIISVGPGCCCSISQSVSQSVGGLVDGMDMVKTIMHGMAMGNTTASAAVRWWRGEGGRVLWHDSGRDQWKIINRWAFIVTARTTKRSLAGGTVCCNIHMLLRHCIFGWHMVPAFTLYLHFLGKKARFSYIKRENVSLNVRIKWEFSLLLISPFLRTPSHIHIYAIYI